MICLLINLLEVISGHFGHVQPVGFLDDGEVEVADDALAVVPDQDVLRLEVPVSNSLLALPASLEAGVLRGREE